MARSRPLAELLGTVPRARSVLAAATALGLTATAATLAQAVALGTALATLAEGGGLARGWLIALVVATALRVAATGALEPVARALARPARRSLRQRAVAQVVRQGRPADVDATVQLLTRGVDEVESYVARVAPARVLAASAPVLVVAFLVAWDALSGVVVLVCAALLPVFMVLIGLAARDAMDARWRDQQRLAAAFGDVVRGMTTLKALVRERHAVARLDQVGSELVTSTMATLRVAFASSFALELLSSLATALVALELGLRLAGGEVGLRVALVVLIATPEAFGPLRRAAARYHGAATGVAALDDLARLLARTRPEGVAPAPARPPRLELRALVARPGSPPLSATVEAGGLAVLTGASGVGKSSVLAVLAGIADPVSGEVLVDGVPLSSVARDSWQRAVGWVAQEPVLAGPTLADAVRRGRAVPEDAVRAALAAVGVTHALAHPVGEGATLSAGERRRVALAACLVDDPVVVLLDEPTAHQDAAREADLWEVLARSGATRVVVSHRPRPGARVVELA